MLDILAAGTHATGRVNDDAVGHHARAAWVIDGATGVGGAPASDGFLRLEELLGTLAPIDLFAIDTPAAFDRHVEALRAMEADAGSCHRFPRVKVHDDASFMLCARAEA